MGRPKAAQWRHIARAQGWLDPAQPLPDDQAITTVLQGPRRASSTVSTLEAQRERVSVWVEQGVSGTAIHAALRRQYGWAGSYSAVRRLVADIRSQLPPDTTCRLDFGADPTLMHPDGKPRRTWAFVVTLASSRHQYVEFVWDQTVVTWLGCALPRHHPAQPAGTVRPGSPAAASPAAPGGKPSLAATVPGVPPRPPTSVHPAWR